MIVLGYITAILIGVSLGLIGAGGSILTVPILVYLLRVSPVLATSYSLFVVGISAMFGSFGYMKNRLLNYKTSFIFGIPSLIGVLISRKVLLPDIPQQLFKLGNAIFTKEICIMMLFAILMIAASISMIKRQKVLKQDSTGVQQYRYDLILIEGLLVGITVGFVGAGGGFLIIPALVILAGEPMKSAIGTSLLIIAVNSLLGFLGDLSNHVEVDWSFLLFFSSFALTGILIGMYLSRHISGAKLKPLFGWVLLVLGVYIISEKIVNL
jgi:uncharacterized protein